MSVNNLNHCDIYYAYSRIVDFIESTERNFPEFEVEVNSNGVEFRCSDKHTSIKKFKNMEDANEFLFAYNYGKITQKRILEKDKTELKTE